MLVVLPLGACRRHQGTAARRHALRPRLRILKPGPGPLRPIDREFNWWIFDGFYRKGLTNPDIQNLIRLKEQGLGRVIRIGDSAQASDIKQLCDAGIAIEGVQKERRTSKENWDEFRARLMEELGRIQEGTGKPKLFISSKLVDLDDEGAEFNFL